MCVPREREREREEGKRPGTAQSERKRTWKEDRETARDKDGVIERRREKRGSEKERERETEAVLGRGSSASEQRATGGRKTDGRRFPSILAPVGRALPS